VVNASFDVNAAGVNIGDDNTIDFGIDNTTSKVSAYGWDVTPFDRVFPSDWIVIGGGHLTNDESDGGVIRFIGLNAYEYQIAPVITAPVPIPTLAPINLRIISYCL
jgi:hypothetical protein